MMLRSPLDLHRDLKNYLDSSLHPALLGILDICSVRFFPNSDHVDSFLMRAVTLTCTWMYLVYQVLDNGMIVSRTFTQLAS